MLIFALLCSNALADSFIWLEGEEASRHDFSHHVWYGEGVNKDLLSPGIPESVEGDWLTNYNWADPGPKSASWDFEAEEAGDYALWLRVAVPATEAWVSVDDGVEMDLDLDANIREQINLVQPELDHRSLGWVYAGQWALERGMHSITYGLEPHDNWGGDLNCGGIDALVFVNFAWGPSGAEKPDLSDIEPAPNAWFPFHPNNPPTDWSLSVAAHPVESPAGDRGRIRRDGEGLVDGSGERIKLWGINAGIPGSVELMEQQADMYAHMGLNLMRHHTVLGMILSDGEIDAAKLDAYDQWFSILKNAGIHVQWSLFYPLVIKESDDYPLFDDLNSGSTSGLVTVFPALQDLEWAVLETMLNHTNPYTGLKYAEDPALAVVEIRNEDSIFWHNPLNPLTDGTYPAHQAALQSDWAEWLTEKYGDDATLLAAWSDGHRTDDSLGNSTMGIYAAWQMGPDGPTTHPSEITRMGDWIEFLAERQRDGYERRIDLVRETGFDGVMVSTAWKAGGTSAALANVWTDDAADAITRHGYAGGGARLSDNWPQLAVGAVNNTSMLTDPGTEIFDKANLQVAGKPYMMSEWTSSPPNEHKLEAVPMFGLYGMGLYGWDISAHFHGGNGWFGGGWPDWGIWAAHTPHHLGQFLAISRAVREGHVQEGTPAAALHFTEADAFGGIDARPEVDPWLAAVGPQTVSFDEGTSSIVDIEEYRDGDFINSQTDELSWNTNGYFRVSTDRTQGVVGKAGGLTHVLPDVTVELETEFVSLLFTSLDGEKLSDSASILITALAKDKQTGSVYSDDGSELTALGGPPLLLEPVQAVLSFGGGDIADVRTLNEFGVPTGSVSDVDGNTVTIDGRWATAWYHVRRGELPDEPDDGGDDPSTDDGAEDAGATEDGATNNGDWTTPGTTDGAAEDADKTGCGCANTPSGANMIPWLLGLVLVGLRRQDPQNHNFGCG